MIADDGYTISVRKKSSYKIYREAQINYFFKTTHQILRGNHGFDNKIPSMRTIFLGKQKVDINFLFSDYYALQARGPNFKKNKTISPFVNVDIYPLICRLIGIKEKPNNGSIDSFKDAIVSIETNTTASSTTLISNTTSDGFEFKFNYFLITFILFAFNMLNDLKVLSFY